MGVAVNSSNNRINEFGRSDTFNYSPYADCEPYDQTNVGLYFGCGHPRKAKVR
jgi:hypothetical protein